MQGASLVNTQTRRRRRRRVFAAISFALWPAGPSAISPAIGLAAHCDPWSRGGSTGVKAVGALSEVLAAAPGGAGGRECNWRARTGPESAARTRRRAALFGQSTGRERAEWRAHPPRSSSSPHRRGKINVPRACA